MNNVKEMDAETFKQEVLNSPTPVLVDFYAPWCGPCRMLAPVLESLAAEFAGKVKFVKVNVDDAQELAVEYQITGVPTLMLFQDGQVRDQIVGLASPRTLRARLQSVATASEPSAVVGRG